ncbi:MAG: hypothetical protein Q9Q13_04535 [Acidobacteriota bacterium]|nr:hypothetical protein [Acidobacteriota bacterium]
MTACWGSCPGGWSSTRWMPPSRQSSGNCAAAGPVRPSSPPARGEGVETLVQRLADRLLGLEVSLTLAVPLARQDIVAELSRRGVVLAWEAVDGRLDVRVQGPAALIARLERELAAGSEEVVG